MKRSLSRDELVDLSRGVVGRGQDIAAQHERALIARSDGPSHEWVVGK
jgi:hypothetical protein